jgi:hypothetical protein
VGYFGITAIRWNDDHTEVEYCMVHELEPQDGRFALGQGRPMWYTDVASLIQNGDKVLVMEENIDGEYERSAAVPVRTGKEEHLQTSPAESLFDLPTF